MTVAQLLEVLRGLDPETTVWRDGRRGHLGCDVKVTEVDYVSPNDPDGRVYIGAGRVVIR